MSKIAVEYACALTLAQYVESGRSPNTIKGMRGSLKHLSAYCAGQGLCDMRNVDRAAMAGYAAFLGAWRSALSGKRLATITKKNSFAAARRLFTVLQERDLILTHPMRYLTLAPMESAAVRVSLSESEVAGLLDSIDTRTPCGLRDKALLELIYSSALRRREASHLNVGDIDFEARLLKIRESKFLKDRMVPITEYAAALLREIADGCNRERPLFPGHGTKRITPRTVQYRFRLYCERYGLYREGLSVHSLRHACATHLLAHGADLRYVQELLGHASVETTVRYTNADSDFLRRRYLRHHPRENGQSAVVDERYSAAFEALVARLTKARSARASRKKP